MSGNTPPPDSSPSRRSLLAPAGAAALAAIVRPRDLAAAVTIPSIRIPTEITTSLNEALEPGSFEGKGMTGAQVFAELCKQEDLKAMFCCPGNYTVIARV